MAKGFFSGIKEGMESAKIDKIESTRQEVENLLGSSEDILYVHTFWNDKMIITNKKLIYMDLKVAKSKTYSMVPFNKITSYALLVPSGLSLKGKLQIFTGGDTPSIQIESILDEGMHQFCRILADNI